MTIKVAFDKGYVLSMSQDFVMITVNNECISALTTIEFYKKIGDRRFLTFEDYILV